MKKSFKTPKRQTTKSTVSEKSDHDIVYFLADCVFHRFTDAELHSRLRGDLDRRSGRGVAPFASFAMSLLQFAESG